jgi:hypothetical protein
MSGPADRLEQSMSTNGLTKYEGCVPPAPMAGWSAWTLVLRGTVIELAGASMVVPLAVAAVGRHDVWTGFFLSIGIAAAVVGGMLSIRGFRKAREEAPKGYATLPKMAMMYQYLYLLHRLDFHVMLYPGQARPRTRNKKDMNAWRPQFDYPENAGR